MDEALIRITGRHLSRGDGRSVPASRFTITIPHTVDAARLDDALRELGVIVRQGLFPALEARWWREHERKRRRMAAAHDGATRELLDACDDGS
jgi:hypothetical protein